MAEHIGSRMGCFSFVGKAEQQLAGARSHENPALA
jgi:hypothetical protein